ncbi:MAG: ABC transporter substrate-binding protein [Xanthobacteraceae bacterium]|nr:ABC transporter substrate-binding protein [Xanthobacteraceae bacterium]MBV9234989.1 ABC transporter substrate-binding protein [Xanthobacteraceae bacterium]MBV9630957.1 ABC transporter substrate-binding protein [Xanthobacteraceae bacterium]
MKQSVSRRRALAIGASAIGLGFRRAIAEQAADLKNVTLRVGDQTGATQSKLKAAGLLDDVPYKIEWSVYAAAVNLHEALKAGAIDTGLAGDAPTISAIAGGSPIQVAAAWSNGGKGVDLIVPHNSSAQSIADLRGKTISPTTRGSIGQYLVIGALKQGGLAAADVTLAFLAPTDAAAAFSAGGIDAWSIWGVYRARALGALKARVLVPGEGIITGLFVLPASRAALADPGKTQAIADFADRIERGYRWSRANKDAQLAWYKSFAKQDKDTAEFLYDEEASCRRVAADDALARQLQTVFATWVEAGVLKGNLDLREYVYRELKIGT